MLLAGSEAARDPQPTSVYMLDMGEPIRIVEMAEKMIQLSGKVPYEDIDIVFTERRPGEKMHEALVAEGEVAVDIGVSGVYALKTPVQSSSELEAALQTLKRAIQRQDRSLAIATLENAWPGTLVADAPPIAAVSARR